MRIDHVMIVTLDVEREIRSFAGVGLGVIEGMSFGDGVRNVLVPMMSGQFLEILYLEGEGSGADWLRTEVAAGRRYAGWAVEVESLTDTAKRLGRPAVNGLMGDSGQPEWQTVQSETPGSFLPFFIQYPWTGQRDAEHNRRLAAAVARAGHQVSAREISGLDLVGDAGEMRTWVGGELALAVTPGTPARLEAIRVLTDDGELVLAEH